MITMYTINIGIITAIDNGVVTMITTIVPKSMNPMIDNIRNVLGNLSSITSISLLKRFIIRPTGVVSKKDIGDRRIQFNPLSCISPVALTNRVNAIIPNKNRVIPEMYHYTLK